MSLNELPDTYGTGILAECRYCTFPATHFDEGYPSDPCGYCGFQACICGVFYRHCWMCDECFEIVKSVRA